MADDAAPQVSEGAQDDTPETANAAVGTGLQSSRPGPWWRRGRFIVLAVALVILVGAGLVFGPTAWRLYHDSGAVIDTPQQVAGLTRDDSDLARIAVDNQRTAMSARVSLDHTVGAVYVGAGGRAQSVIFTGGTGALLEPATSLNALFDLITDQEGSVEHIREEAAGPLGGVLKCGSSRTKDIALTVCGWADHGSLALALFFGRDIDESARLFLDMRSAMQHR